MMKNRLIAALLAAGLLLTGCTAGQEEAPAPDEAAESHTEVLEESDWEAALLGLAAEQTDRGLLAAPGSPLCAEWASPEDLEPDWYYLWYLQTALGALSHEEKQARYADPSGGEDGWWIPAAELEPAVESAFGLESDFLRADTTLYHADANRYCLGGGPGIGDRPVIAVLSARQDGENWVLTLRETWQMNSEETAELTLRRNPDGSWRYLSHLYVTEE